MDFSAPQSRRRTEPILPMINVVFLLLIFFLMTAQLRPPEPVPIALPDAQKGQAATGDLVLHVGADGRAYFQGVQGPAAMAGLEQLAAERAMGARAPLQIRADAGLEAKKLARLMQDLAAMGYARVDLMVTTP